MIRINLLAGAASSGGAGAGVAVQTAEGTAEESKVQREGATKLFLILLPVVAMYIYELQSIPDLKNEKSRLTKSLAEMKTYNSKAASSVLEIKKIKADEEQIQQRISALEQLSKNRVTEIKVLKLFADVIPEKAWFTKLEIKKGRASIIGLAVSNSEVSSLAERLKSNIHIAELQLVKINEEKLDGQPVFRFEFNCLLEAAK